MLLSTQSKSRVRLLGPMYVASAISLVVCQFDDGFRREGLCISEAAYLPCQPCAVIEAQGIAVGTLPYTALGGDSVFGDPRLAQRPETRVETERGGGAGADPEGSFFQSETTG